MSIIIYLFNYKGTQNSLGQACPVSKSCNQEFEEAYFLTFWVMLEIQVMDKQKGAISKSNLRQPLCFALYIFLQSCYILVRSKSSILPFHLDCILFIIATLLFNSTQLNIAPFSPWFQLNAGITVVPFITYNRRVIFAH